MNTKKSEEFGMAVWADWLVEPPSCSILVGLMPYALGQVLRLVWAADLNPTSLHEARKSFVLLSAACIAIEKVIARQALHGGPAVCPLAEFPLQAVDALGSMAVNQTHFGRLAKLIVLAAHPDGKLIAKEATPNGVLGELRANVAVTEGQVKRYGG